jgi:hypothetical protein
MDKFQYNMTMLNVEHLKRVITEENKTVWRSLVLTKCKQSLKGSILFVLSPATEKTDNSRYSCIVDKAIFPCISLSIHHIERCF